jgi:hypothetical protein
MERAVERRPDASRAGVALAGVQETPPDLDQTSVTRLWWQKPDRVRLERDEPGTRRGGWVEVAVGERWWGYHPEWGAVSNEGDPQMRSGGQDAPFPELFEPSLHIPALDLDLAGSAEQAGRRGILVRGRPRELDPNLFTPVLPRGADEHELLIDAEIGTVLRRTSFIDGEPFAVAEVEGIAFDEPFGPETFVFIAPTGLAIRPADEVFRSLPPGLGAGMEPPPAAI